MRTEVLHFERLSHRIFQEIGGLTEDYASKGALEMMVFDILQSHRSELNLYQSQTKYYGFSAKLSEQIQDFKSMLFLPHNSNSLLLKINCKQERKINCMILHLFIIIWKSVWLIISFLLKTHFINLLRKWTNQHG